MKPSRQTLKVWHTLLSARGQQSIEVLSDVLTIRICHRLHLPDDTSESTILRRCGPGKMQSLRQSVPDLFGDLRGALSRKEMRMWISEVGSRKEKGPQMACLSVTREMGRKDGLGRPR